jgi:hypothetical protein
MKRFALALSLERDDHLALAQFCMDRMRKLITLAPTGSLDPLLQELVEIEVGCHCLQLPQGCCPKGCVPRAGCAFGCVCVCPGLGVCVQHGRLALLPFVVNTHHPRRSTCPR